MGGVSYRYIQNTGSDKFFKNFAEEKDLSPAPGQAQFSVISNVFDSIFV